jgi:hypothetical protein
MGLGTVRHAPPALSLLLLAACSSAPPRPTTPDPVDALPAPPVEATPTTRVVLPLSGLAVELPDLPDGGAYAFGGGWLLSPEGGYYGRDVIEERGGAGDLVGGSWVFVGHYDGKTCEAMLADDEVIAFAWPAESRELAGRTWVVRGGLAEIPGLGKLPAIRACTGASNEHKLTVYRFFLGEAESMSADAMVAALGGAPVVGAVAAAYGARSSGPVQPTRDVNVSNLGEVSAVRAVQFGKLGLSITLPDDGFVWRVLPQSIPDGPGYLFRLAPTFPAISVRVYLDRGVTCAGQYALLSVLEVPAARGVAGGWSPGPVIADDPVGHTVCRDDPAGGSVLVAVVGSDGELASFQPLLDAIAAGVADGLD